MNEKVLYLMRGIPGSGKSTVATMIANATNGVTCSTDDFWYDEDGVYQFDITKLGVAHKLNQRKAAEYMGAGQESVIIDNTNINAKDMKPYILLADLFGYTVQLIEVSTALNVCLQRNAERSPDRQIPEKVITEMDYKSKQSPIDIDRVIRDGV